MTSTAMALLYGSTGKKKAGADGARGYGGGGILVRRVLLLVLLICCSPILIPLLLLASPVILLLCFAGACLRRPSRGGLTVTEAVNGGARCGGDGRALLQRYLEDQLGLALAFGEEDAKAG